MLNRGPTYWLPSLAIALGIFCLFVGTAWILRRYPVAPEGGRKLVHVISGVTATAVPLLFAKEQILVGLAIVGALLTLGARKKLFQGVIREGRSINGPFCFLAAFGLLVMITDDGVELALPILVLTFADTAAGLIGAKYGTRRLGVDQARTWIGVAAFAVTAAAVSLAVLAAHIEASLPTLVLLATTIALATCAAEAISPTSADNFTIPMVAYLILLMYRAWPVGVLWELTLAAELAACVLLAVIALQRRWLTGDGALALLLIGVLVVSAGGLAIAIALLMFFVSSSVLTRLALDRAVQSDSHGRRASQVLALGLAPAAGAVAYAITGESVWNAAALAAVAAATADTWATEIGRRSRRPPRHLLTLRVVPAGTSGAVSGMGLSASIAGAGAIAAFGWVTGICTTPGLILMTGAAASLVDSLLGATVQARYRCIACGDLDDVPSICHGQRRARLSGIPVLNNEAVNFTMSCFAAVLALIAYQI